MPNLFFSTLLSSAAENFMKFSDLYQVNLPFLHPLETLLVHSTFGDNDVVPIHLW